MKTRSFLLVAVLSMTLLAGCAPPAARVAKRDSAIIGQSAALARVGVSEAQDDNASLARSNAAMRAQHAAVRSDAQRIDDKAVILQNARWTL